MGMKKSKPKEFATTPFGSEVIRKPKGSRTNPDFGPLIESLLDASVSTRNHDLTDQILGEFSNYSSSAEYHQKRIRQILSKLTVLETNNLIYKFFSKHYDHHMTDHRVAIQSLIKQVTMADVIGLNINVFGRRNLEMSCGTGTIIRLINDSLPFDRLPIFFVANEPSPDMKNIAIKKLSDINVDFSSFKIGNLNFERNSFDTVILSQTLHLLVDEVIISQERQSGYMFVGGQNRHIRAKYNAIMQAYDLIKPGGTFVLIDEWPHLLSDGGPLGPGFAFLFNENVRFIEQKDLKEKILDRLPNSRFVAELSAPIDNLHTMYLNVYQKEPSQEEISIGDAEIKLIEIFKNLDKRFVDSTKPPPRKKPVVNFLKVKKNETFTYVSELPSGSECFNCIIITNAFDNLQFEQKLELISKSSTALKTGGSLFLVTELGSKTQNSEADFEKIMDNFSDHLVRISSIRIPSAVSGLYGLHYRKVF